MRSVEEQFACVNVVRYVEGEMESVGHCGAERVRFLSHALPQCCYSHHMIVVKTLLIPLIPNTAALRIHGPRDD